VEQEWADFGREVVEGSDKKFTIVADGLEPGTTYCLRLVAMSGSDQSDPSPELIIDTEQVGCGPSSEGGGCCTIQ